ncbi:universal stress protein [Terrabacter aerolatus]|uniref:Universal stress protein UspA n=1 Tax=Terrabacter aerolatus TaxID=422442 RepID=A0A512CYI2_9MICO|nr:universal stress protein [Terrabacter aerolatus]GEO29070.1 universal stress protein UspA [Terrabacter aerolatus]
MDVRGLANGVIVVGYDGSPASQRALVWAAAVSRALGDSLKIVHAVELDVVPSRRGYALRPLQPSLEMVAETVVGSPSTWPGTPLGRSRVRAVHAFGGPAAELVDASMTADLVVLGTRGRGRARSSLAGSVSGAVVARSYCPVVVLHGVGNHPPGTRRDVPVPGPSCEVVCAVRSGAGSAEVGKVERIVSAAARLASACSAPLRLITVGDGGRAGSGSGVEPYATDTLALGHPDTSVTAQALAGDPVEVVTRTSRDCGLLVIGAPRHGGTAAVLAGTTAHRIIHDATCPVMIVH